MLDRVINMSFFQMTRLLRLDTVLLACSTFWKYYTNDKAPTLSCMNWDEALTSTFVTSKPLRWLEFESTTDVFLNVNRHALLFESSLA